MTVETFLTHATQKLRQAGIMSARLDVLVLLEDTLQLNRAQLLAHPEIQIQRAILDVLNNYITQRERHVPLAYIRGKAAFYGRDFIVNTHVLVPRPETEVMIEMLINISLPAHAKVADIGTGTGCIAITAALEVPDIDVYAYDIDASALTVARANTQAYNARVHIAQADLLQNCKEHFEVILANLPYVPENYAINKAASFEPSIALFAGEDGLDLYRTLWHQIPRLPNKPRHVLTESLLEQHEELAAIAKASGYTLVQTQGLIQHFKVA